MVGHRVKIAVVHESLFEDDMMKLPDHVRAIQIMHNFGKSYRDYDIVILFQGNQGTIVKGHKDAPLQITLDLMAS